MPEIRPIAAAPLARIPAENYLNSWWTDVQHGDVTGRIALRQATRAHPSTAGNIHIEIPEPAELIAAPPGPDKALGASLAVRGVVRVQQGATPPAPQQVPQDQETWYAYGRRHIFQPTSYGALGWRAASRALNIAKGYAVIEPSQIFLGRGPAGSNRVEILSAKGRVHVLGHPVPVPYAIPLHSFDQNQQAMWRTLTQACSDSLVDMLMSGFRPQILNLVNLVDLAHTQFTLQWTGGEAVRWIPPADDVLNADRQALSLTPRDTQVQVGLACTGANKYGIKIRHAFDVREGEGVDTRVTVEGECYVSTDGAPMQPGRYAPLPNQAQVPQAVPGGREGGYVIKLLQQIFATGVAQDPSEPVRLTRRGWQTVDHLVLPTVALPPALARWQVKADGQALRVLRTGRDNALTVVSDRPIVLRPAADTTGWSFLQRRGLQWLDGLIARHLTVNVSSVSFSASGESMTVQGFVRLGWLSVSFGKQVIDLPNLADIDALAQMEALGGHLQGIAFDPLIPTVMALADMNTQLQVTAKRGGQLTLNAEQELIGRATKMLLQGDSATASLQALYEHEARIRTQSEGLDTHRDVRVSAAVSVQQARPLPQEQPTVLVPEN